VVRVNPAVALAVVAGVALGIGLWSLASLTPRMSRPRLARRVAPYLVDVSASARASLAPAPPGPLPLLGSMLDPFTDWARAVLSNLLGGSDVVARRLRQAGSRMSVETFRSRQLLWGVGAAGAGVALAILGGAAQRLPLTGQVAVVVLAAVGGVVLRDQILQRAAKRRLSRLDTELPVVLEFLTLSLSAGEGILDALRRVSRVSRGELAQELASVVSDVNTGLPFGDTLRVLATTLDLPAFTRCVDQIVGALDRGTPLAEVLRAQAQDSRDEGKRRLLELAGKKEVAMLFPLVFLILPITVIFAVFPGIFVLQVGL
jgi:tight adherence protein C